MVTEEVAVEMVVGMVEMVEMAGMAAAHRSTARSECKTHCRRPRNRPALGAERIEKLCSVGTSRYCALH